MSTAGADNDNASNIICTLVYPVIIICTTVYLVLSKTQYYLSLL